MTSVLLRDFGHLAGAGYAADVTPPSPVTPAADEVARLTAAARTVLARGGWWGFKVESVLRTAGLSTRCFYRHFESKDHLLLRLLQEDISRGASRLERICNDPDPLVRIRAWLDGILDMAYIHRVAKPTVLFAAHWHQLLGTFPDEVEQCRDQLMGPLLTALQDLKASGRSALELRPEQDALALFHVVSGPTADIISRQGQPDRATTESLLVPIVGRIVGLDLPDASRPAWEPDPKDQLV